MKRKIILQTLNWKITDIINNLSKIKDTGYTHIQISPVTPTKNEENQWYWLYQPTNFTIGNRLGTKEDLKELCKEAHKLGLKIVVDVVLRHLAGADSGELKPSHKCNPLITENKHFWLEPRNGNDYRNRYEETKLCWGMPSLDYSNQELQDLYVIFLDELVECGVDGFRYDMLKHFLLPEEGCNFLTRVCGRYKEKGIWQYGECIDTHKEMLDKYTQYVDVLSNWNCSDDNKLITWIESHDDFFTWKKTCHLSDEMRLNEWQILLQHHKNCIFFARPFDNVIFDNRMKAINCIYNSKC